MNKRNFKQWINELNSKLIYQLPKENHLLTEIIIISNKDMYNKIVNEFHSTYNIYTFEDYLEILKRVKKLLLQGFDNFNYIKFLIKTNMDLLL